MNQKFILTKRFKESLSIIHKEYRYVIKDLKEEFKNSDFNVIFEKNYIISNSGVSKIIKLRIKNSSANKGKRGGFRLIYYANKETKEVVFLEIYSKIGKNKKDNLADREYVSMLKEYKKEKLSVKEVHLRDIKI